MYYLKENKERENIFIIILKIFKWKKKVLSYINNEFKEDYFNNM